MSTTTALIDRLLNDGIDIDPDIAEPSAMRTDADAIARGEVPLWYPYDEFTRPCEEIAADVRALAELLDA